ncbi:uncharacterized protein BJ212DRAFT_1450746 [Suillus subaureus]|uniref:C2H2-type domain-containing protein n=1 Tax=Suillus subaureus TaxID=48587 RepID=A0A9P7AVE5_9AGAM|nr:uncharacterized protein BJ212DRAFT_1450746 [Suillus subaureus]KAG1795563.1 hypothetical protein BJ212DRAFT_1450746 [Suillus subaureus]
MMGDCLMEGDELEMKVEVRLCPNCSGEFPSIETVVLHLNSQSTCWPHKAHLQQLPVPPALRGSHSLTSDATGHCHPHSEYVFGVSKNLFDRLQEDQYNYWRETNAYYPFYNEGEWDLARFLVENLNQTQIDKFLKLKWFSTRPKPSFTSKKNQLLGWMDTLPCFAEWKVSCLEFTGYKTTHPIQLIWHDALEVIKQLFSDPVFANHITFQPHIANVRNQHKYGDYMSTDLAWKIQDHLPLGATQVPIILGSNKTPVTRTTRGLKMHPIFITIGNFDLDIHSKATLRAWRCIAYMPIAKYPNYQSIFQAWLWHKCIDLVCANLKLAAKNGCFMSNPSKFIHYIFMPLITHVCDLPEASMITAISKTVDVWDLNKFQKAAKAVHLSGVHMPYWHDWMFILHTCLNFFADHLLNWIKEVVGKPELNARFVTQHKWVGTCHFTKDIQHTIVAAIAGAAPPRFICAICALIEFFYLAQNPVHSPETLLSMMQALADFHAFKDAVVKAQARRGKNGAKEDFFIPKLELLQSFRGISVQILNCQESMKLFNLYALFCSLGTSLVNVICIEDEAVTTINLVLSWVSCVLPDEINSIHGPQLVHNHFLKGILSEDVLTAFHLTSTPDFKSLSPTNIHTKYLLTDFDDALSQFIRRSSISTGEHTHWDHRYRVIRVYPPDDEFPLGNCDNVLVDITGDNGQISMSILLNLPHASDLVLPSFLSCPLLYIQYYHFIASPNDCPELAMWTVEHSYMEDQHGKHRCGGMVPLMSVTHTVKLIPEYGEKVDKKITSAICLESYDQFCG